MAKMVRENRNGSFVRKKVSPNSVQTCTTCKITFQSGSIWKRRNGSGIADTLCNKCYSLINSKENEMWNAIENGDAEKLKETIASGADSRDMKNGKTVLDRALNQNKSDCYSTSGETIGEILRKNGCPQKTAGIPVILPTKRIIPKKEQRLEPEKGLYSNS